MDDGAQIGLALDEAKHRVAIGNIKPGEPEAGIGVQPGKPSLLEGDIVIIVQIIDADDLLAAVQQRSANMETDKAGGTSEENRHLLSDDRVGVQCRWCGA